MSVSPDSRVPAPSPAAAPPRRARALLAAVLATLLVGSLAGTVHAQEAPRTTDPAEAAAGWLARQLVDGERLVTDFGGTAYDDQGLTADAILAFAAAGVADEAAQAATDWLARPDVLTAYIGDGADGSYAGATAKTALVAIVRPERDPRAFGGVDLIQRLLDREQTTGRFTDLSDWGDYSNVFGQSFAVIALHRASGVAPSAESIAMLRGSQCPDGGFSQELEPAECASQVDATTFAIQALVAVGAGGTDAALDWLVAQQAADGSFGGNANSTGLAAQALAAGGRTDAAAAAVGYLVDLQIGCDGDPAEHGAVPLDEEGVDNVTTRATAQAIGGLAGVGLGTASAVGASPASPALDCSPDEPTPTEPPVTEPPAAAPPTTAPPTTERVQGVGAGTATPAASPAAPVARATPSYAG